MRLILILLLAIIATNTSADVIEIETPVARHVYADCVSIEPRIARYGTVATIIATCGNRYTTAQVPGWFPDPHPDGLALRFESRFVATMKTPAAFLECELTDYTGGSSQRWQCLDDPIPAARRRTR